MLASIKCYMCNEEFRNIKVHVNKLVVSWNLKQKRIMLDVWILASLFMILSFHYLNVVGGHLRRGMRESDVCNLTVSVTKSCYGLP